ncbi:MAG: cation-translocating P-type ATPase, partial [Nitrospirae bacterium]
LKGFSLNNDVQLGQEGNLVGDPTEIALLSFSEKMGFEKADTEKQHPRVMELPFDSERKMMTTLHKEGNQYIAFTKGGVDQIIERSTAMLTDDGIREIDPERILSANAEIARKGQRVLGLAMKRLTALPEKPEELENELIFVGLAGMIDPPRKEAYDAVRLCKKAGIRPVMITGDHPLTAEVIAKRLGIIESEQDIVTTGRQLREIPEEELKEKVEHIRVYARVAPEQKLRIVKALQGRGEFVAMTGDGVNDAPALKRADIGIAMGITGTDVSREAAHMVLLDDNFATIVKAIREGRKIYDNIRKFIRYLLTTNSGEVWTLFLAPFLGLPVPLLPIHILWINLMTDSLPALALSLEPEEKGIMERPPRRPGEGIFSRGLGFDALWVGLFMAGLVLFTEVWSIGKGHEHWQTMVFTVMCLTQLGNVLAIRSEEESFFRLGVFSNPALLGAVVVSFILQMAVVYIPYLNPIFKTAPLTAGEIGFCVFLSSLVFVAVELKKLLSRLMKRKATR